MLAYFHELVSDHIVLVSYRIDLFVYIVEDKSSLQ
jgi:hypothetical protein